MTEKEFQELFDALCATQGLNSNKARLVSTWTLAARGYVGHAVDCLPHLVFVGTMKVPRDRAVSLVAASIKGHFVELTVERRGIILINDYDELSKEDADIVRNMLLRPQAPCAALCLWGADGFLSQTGRRRLSFRFERTAAWRIAQRMTP